MSFSCLLLHVFFSPLFSNFIFSCSTHTPPPPSHLTHLSVCCFPQPSSPVKASEEARASAPQRCRRRNVKWSLTNGAPRKQPPPPHRQFVWNEHQRRTSAMETRRKPKSKRIIHALTLRLLLDVTNPDNSSTFANSRSGFNFLLRAV